MITYKQLTPPRRLIPTKLLLRQISAVDEGHFIMLQFFALVELISTTIVVQLFRKKTPFSIFRTLVSLAFAVIT